MVISFGLKKEKTDDEIKEMEKHMDKVHELTADHNEHKTIWKKLCDLVIAELAKMGINIPRNEEEFHKIFGPSTLNKRQANFDEILRQPKTYNELKELLIESAKEQKNIKAVGTRFGWLDITFTNEDNGIEVDMNKYINKPSININTNLLNENGLLFHKKGNLIQTEAGCTYTQLANHLWPKDKRRQLKDDNDNYYKVFKFIGYPDLSLAGSISCGCQGWGTWYNKEGGSIPNGIPFYIYLYITTTL